MKTATPSAAALSTAASLMPELYGKYIFGDITTARLFYADLADMIANDDGDRTSVAAVHELQVVFDSPHDSPDQGPVNRRLFDIVADEYARQRRQRRRQRSASWRRQRHRRQRS